MDNWESLLDEDTTKLGDQFAEEDKPQLLDQSLQPVDSQAKPQPPNPEKVFY